MSASTTNASPVKKNNQEEYQVIETDIHIGVFFDGTNNNANNNDIIDYFKWDYFISKNHALNDKIGNIDRRLSNPAILSTLFTKDRTSKDKSKHFIRAYIEGSGTNTFVVDNVVADFFMNGKPLLGLGCGMGKTGVVSKVSKAIRIVGDEIKKIALDPSLKIKGIHFYVFGFSRGSACARLFAFIVARAKNKNLPVLRENEKDKEKFDVETAFRKYLSLSLSGWNYQNNKVCFLCGEKWEKLIGTPDINVDFLGIYDTVSAIGLLKHGDEIDLKNTDTSIMELHYKNARRFGLYSPSHIKSTCHICAMDEFRANFALTDIGSAANQTNNIELFMPGCHSDIGGGYGYDSKAETKTLELQSKGVESYFFDGPLVKASLLSPKWTKLSYKLFEDMGWIVNERNELKSGKDNIKKIVFVHAPKLESSKDIYSNLTLMLMIERAKCQITDFNIIFSDLPMTRKVPSHSILNKVWTELSNLIEKEHGRYCYIPNDALYQDLRANYLHFTATDKLINIKSLGDIGNEPAKRIIKDEKGKYRYITRYVYRGGDNDDSNVHYMDEYIDWLS